MKYKIDYVIISTLNGTLLIGAKKKGQFKMRRNYGVQKLVLTSTLLAIVVVLQLFASSFTIGIATFSLVLVPISIGAILLGPKTGALLGFAFGFIVLFQADAQYFMGYGMLSTIAIVLLKGTLAGFCSGIVYKMIKEKNKNIAAILASLVAPIVNTLVFIIGVSFLLNDAVGPIFEFIGSILGINFVVEFLITAILSPAIIKITLLGFKQFNIQN